SVVDRLIEYRTTDQRRQPRHRFGRLRFNRVPQRIRRALTLAARGKTARIRTVGMTAHVLPLPQPGKHLFLEIMSDFDRVSKHLKAGPGLSQRDAKAGQNCESEFV